MEIFSRDGIDYTIEECSVGDIINYNEILAIKILREILKKNSSFCQCSICIEDAFALTMNALPPRYIQITSSQKYINSKSFIGETAVWESAMKALEKVRGNPNH
jgi:competence protein ComFB